VATSSTKQREHTARLGRLREGSLARIEVARAELLALMGDLADVDADQDEGGGEGDGTQLERDRLRAAIATDELTLESIDAAILRADSDRWNRCATCGGKISLARIQAVPAADRCVTCKAASTTW
jgi:RNA polymerase-binding transcription factor DksA